MSQQSLADMAVEILGRVQQMSDGIGSEHPERHAIREMKQAAEQVLIDAFGLPSGSYGRLALCAKW